MTQTAEADLKYCGPPAKKQAQSQERDNPAVTHELNKVIAGPGDSGTPSKKTSSGSGN
jgi:hypothetical protein